jgi:hypothetical protein
MKAESPSQEKKNKSTAEGRGNGLCVLGVFLLPVLVIGVAAAVMWLMSRSGLLGAVGSGSEFFPAVLISVVGAGAGSAALVMTWRFWPSYLPQGVLAAMGLRMFTTLAGILIFTLILGKLGLQFVLLIIGFYALGLISETVVALKIAFGHNEA